MDDLNKERIKMVNNIIYYNNDFGTYLEFRLDKVHNLTNLAFYDNVMRKTEKIFKKIIIGLSKQDINSMWTMIEEENQRDFILEEDEFLINLFFLKEQGYKTIQMGYCDEDKVLYKLLGQNKTHYLMENISKPTGANQVKIGLSIADNASIKMFGGFKEASLVE